jgi:hypothetical protein
MNYGFVTARHPLPNTVQLKAGVQNSTAKPGAEMREDRSNYTGKQELISAMLKTTTHRSQKTYRHARNMTAVLLGIIHQRRSTPRIVNRVAGQICPCTAVL